MGDFKLPNSGYGRFIQGKFFSTDDDDNDNAKKYDGDEDKVVGTFETSKKQKIKQPVEELTSAKSRTIEENERVDDAYEAVKWAFAAVRKAQENVDEWDDRVESNLDSPEQLRFCRQERDTANESLDKAHVLLKEARDYHLQLEQNAREVGNVSTRFEARHPFFSSVGTVDEKDDMLTFPAPIPLTARNTMYIRSSYSVIYEAVIAGKGASGRKYAVVTGTPGIGKSSFLYYFFWRMVKEKMRVYYVEKALYFDGAKMWQFTTMPPSLNVQFWTVDLWCLIDSADPTKIPGLQIDDCSILLITTPRHDYLSRFRKLVPIPSVFFMPLWSRDELERIVGLYPDASSWENRFTVLGGVPRYVLEDVSKQPESLLRSACNDCSPEDAIHEVSIDSEITSTTKVFQNLIHLHSKDPFIEAEACYASQAAVTIIVNTHYRRDVYKVESLLSSATGNTLAAALCGYIFEPYAKKLLHEGGEFVCRELFATRDRRKGKAKKRKAKKRKATNDNFTIKIPPSPSSMIVADRVESNQTPNQLYIPKTPNYASIDAWIPHFGAFQIMVGKTHGIKNGAADDIAKLGGDSSFRIFYMLPPLYFGSYTTKKTGDFDFKQYAILIPYPEVIQEDNALDEGIVI